MYRSVLIHNIRSTHNVGAILRTCDGLGITDVIFSGYTPYPSLKGDARLPHIHQKLTRQIHKASLGAEATMTMTYSADIMMTVTLLKRKGVRIIGLEQDARSNVLHDYVVPQTFALLIGEEVDGITPELRDQCDDLIEIPMMGHKESFNVSIATGIALYQLTR